MLRYLALSVFAFLVAPGTANASSCSLTYNANDEMAAIIKREKFGFAEYDRLCPWLKENGLVVHITSDNGVLQGRAFGWVVVRVMRSENEVISRHSNSTTLLANTADSPSAEGANMDALNSALNNLYASRSDALKALQDEEARLKGFFGGG
jgi:hypothetical protein